MLRTKQWAVLAACLFSIPCSAQTLSLSDIENNIVIGNPTLRMYDAEIRSMDEAAKGARSWMPPEVSTGLRMTPYNFSMIGRQTDGMGNAREGMGQYMIGVQQMLPNRKKQDAEASYMKAMSAVERERRENALNDLKSAARKARYQWLIGKKKLFVLGQNEKVLQFMIQNAELRYKNGLEKISAYYKAKAALGKTENMRVMIESDISQQRIALNTLMRRSPHIAFEIDTIYSITDFPAPLFDTAHLSARSDIRAIDRSISLAYLQQSAEQAKLRPEFGLSYDHMIGLSGQPAQYNLMGMVRLPFVSWAGRMYRANVESLHWKAEALSQQRQMMLYEYSGMAARMQQEYAQKKRQVKLYEDNIIPALRRNYQTMQLGYEQNTEELFMLYDAWETLNMTQLEYLDLLQQLLTTEAELDRILQTI